MELKLERIFRAKTFTIGELYVNEEYICDTLEDPVRLLPKVCPNTPNGIDCNCKEKVYGETAIPNGVYEIKLTYSNKFQKTMPELLNVPHFLGIRFHSGNKSGDVEGCILTGTWDGFTEDWISDSRDAYNKLFAMLKEASDKGEKITITIKNLE